MFDQRALIMELLRRKRMQEMMAQSSPLGALAGMTVGELVALLTGGRGGMLPPPVALPPVASPPVLPPPVVDPPVLPPRGAPADPAPVEPLPDEPYPESPAQS